MNDRPVSPASRASRFLQPLGVTQTEFAERIGVSYVRINEIINGKRGVSPSTALRLAKALGTSPQFWLNGQLAVDLYKATKDKEQMRAIEQIEPLRMAQ